jgi:hypothetical protein
VVRHPARASFRELYRRRARIIGGEHDGRRLGLAPATSLRGEIAGDLRAARQRTPLLWRDPGVPGAWMKIRALLILYALTCAGLWERARLRLGGTSRR